MGILKNLQSQQQTPQNENTTVPVGNGGILSRIQNQTAQPQQENVGVFKNLVRAVAQPALRPLANVYKIGEALGGGKDTTSPVDFGYLGKAKPIAQEGTPIQKVKDIAGAGLNLASYIPMTKGVVGVGKATLGGLIKQGAKIGAKEGLIGGTMTGIGTALEQDKGIGETAVEGLKSGAMGLGFGTALGGLAPVVGKTVRGELGQLKPNLSAVKTNIARANVPEKFETSIQRLTTPKTNIPLKEVKSPLQKYNEYFNQELKFKKDIKADTAISKVGEDIGNEFEKIINSRRNIGKIMGDEIKKVGMKSIDVSDSFPKFEQELADSGVIFSKGKVKLSDTSKITSQDARMLNDYILKVNKLGANPTAGQLDAFLSRVPKELNVYKASNNIIDVTNGERMIKGNLRELTNNLIKDPELSQYANARKQYSELSDFIEEGTSYLGKKTQSGDFAKDASIAKSSVQSILNNGKKDWLLKLEDLTGYQAVDNSMVALQAMKDAGNFRGLSLLETLSQGGNIPLTKTGVIDRVIGSSLEKGRKMLVGTPDEQTKRVILENMNQNGLGGLSGLNNTNKKQPIQIIPKAKSSIISNTIPQKPKISNTQSGKISTKPLIGAGVGSLAGIEKDEEGKYRYNAGKGLAGALGGAVLAGTYGKGDQRGFVKLPGGFQQITKNADDIAKKATPEQIKIIDDWYSFGKNDRDFLSTMEELGVKAKNGEIKSEDLNRFAKDILDTNLEKQGIGVNKAKLPVSDDLTSVAKKFDNAREFFKSEINKYTTKTENPIKVFRGEGKGIGNYTTVKGKYFADSKEFASVFGDVTEYTIPKGSKIFDLDMLKNKNQKIFPKEMIVDVDAMTNFFEKNGYDYLKNTNARGVEYVLPRLYTKEEQMRRMHRPEIYRDETPIKEYDSPLTSIWEKAHNK